MTEEEDYIVHQGDLIFNLLVKVTRKIDRNIDIYVEVGEIRR